MSIIEIKFLPDKEWIQAIGNLWKAVVDFRSKRYRKLSGVLLEITKLLTAVHKSFQKEKVPTLNAKKLARLINYAEDIAIPLTKKKGYAGLAEVFSLQLPKIGKLMREADCFIDGKKRVGSDYSYELRQSANYKYLAKGKINEACEEIERAIGVLEAYIFELNQKGG